MTTVDGGLSPDDAKRLAGSGTAGPASRRLPESGNDDRIDVPPASRLLAVGNGCRTAYFDGVL